MIFNYKDPYFFILLIIFPFLFWLIFLKKNKNTSPIIYIEYLKKSKTISIFDIVNIFRKLLILSIFIITIFSLAGPQKENIYSKETKNGIDIIIALDTSESMLAEDIKPNRIEEAKKSIKKFIKKLDNDRLGLIIFAGKSFARSPLTFDYSILNDFVDEISTKSINNNYIELSGTAIGDAILNSINIFKDSENRSKVLILITDGDANKGINPNIASQLAKKNNIKIYSLGIGKEEGAPIPSIDKFGNKSYLADIDGKLLLAKFKEKNLIDISNISDGKYYRITEENSLDKILLDISKLEKQDLDIDVKYELITNYKPYILTISILFIFYIAIITYKNIKY